MKGVGNPRTSVASTAAAVTKVWAEVVTPLCRIAAKSTDDRDLRDDMLQEAQIFLWEIDPTRFNLRDRHERKFLIGMLVSRVREVRRRAERRT